MDFKDFARSDAGRLALFKKRKDRRVYVSMIDIEPQSKKMPPPERLDFRLRLQNS